MPTYLKYEYYLFFHIELRTDPELDPIFVQLTRIQIRIRGKTNRIPAIIIVNLAALTVRSDAAPPRDQPENDRENLETDGQSRQAVPGIIILEFVNEDQHVPIHFVDFFISFFLAVIFFFKQLTAFKTYVTNWLKYYYFSTLLLNCFKVYKIWIE